MRRQHIKGVTSEALQSGFLFTCLPKVFLPQISRFQAIGEVLAAIDSRLKLSSKQQIPRGDLAHQNNFLQGGLAKMNLESVKAKLKDLSQEDLLSLSELLQEERRELVSVVGSCPFPPLASGAKALRVLALECEESQVVAWITAWEAEYISC